MHRRWILWVTAIVVGVGVGAVIAAQTTASPQPAWTNTVSSSAAESNPTLDPGTALTGRAPDFTLVNQFGKRVSLHSFRGKVVVLTFNDPECTTICPLTTTALLRAKELLGASASDVQLVGVGANPTATQVKWVRAYSVAHGMLHKWDFLTGSLKQLRSVWAEYGIEAAVVGGLIDHTPATYVIDRHGRLSRLYMTEMAYSSVDQLGQEIAKSVAAELPSHPHLPSLSLAAIPLNGPRKQVTLPQAVHGSVRLGPGSGPHLVLFFDTWESELSNLSADMEGLNGYAKVAAREHLPPLVAIDESDVESSLTALPRFLQKLPHPLKYPVAVDGTGTVADGYRVQDSPWLELVSGSGRFVFYYDVSVKGWPTTAWLVKKVRAGLARKTH